MTMTTARTIILLMALTMIASTVEAQEAVPADQGVFEYVVSPVAQPMEASAEAIRAAAAEEGWEILATVESDNHDHCDFQSMVLVLFDRDYASVYLRANAASAPFAAVDRVNVFEDEAGVHVAIVNPHSIVRTVMMNDGGYVSFIERHRQKLRSMIVGAVAGQESHRQYGQVRDRGYIGRTMGIMAGGRFDGKIEDVMLVREPFESLADRVESALQLAGPRWGTTLKYRLDLPEHRTVLFGTTGTPLDSQSFEIVGAGGDSARDEYACPGLAHAGAYPIEVVVVETDQGTAVRMVDSMYRMKMYFEDAGKLAFMKNMTMPGSIAGEIKDKLVSIATPH
ncbi:MAG: hypothetical protein R3282_05665 [Rhodothermales bacterium]|nr:hypothetical protein [Rhodothermales bacterium]